MYNFTLIFQDTNVPPNKITIQTKDEDLASAKTKVTTMLGDDTKGNAHVYVKTISVQEIPEIEEDPA